MGHPRSGWDREVLLGTIPCIPAVSCSGTALQPFGRLSQELGLGPWPLWLLINWDIWICGVPSTWIWGSMPVKPGVILVPDQGDCQLLGSELVPFLGPKAAPLKDRELVLTSSLCPEAFAVNLQ